MKRTTTYVVTAARQGKTAWQREKTTKDDAETLAKTLLTMGFAVKITRNHRWEGYGPRSLFEPPAKPRPRTQEK